MGLKKLNVYIIHAEHLVERRRVIDDIKKNLAKYSFSKLKVNEIITITAHDPSGLTADKIKEIVNYTPLQTEDEAIKVYNGLTRVLHVNNVSNALKHFEALQKIAADPDPDIVHMVLEDDVMFEPKMCMLLDKAVGQIASNTELGAEVVFLGMPNNEAISNSNQVTIKDSKAIFKVLPYNDSYIITPRLASKLAKEYMPIKFYTNIHLSYLLEKMKIPISQTVPNLFVDGTKFGMFLSTQVVNNDLVFNREFMFLKNVLGKAPDQITSEDKTTIERLIKEGQLAGNPDFLCLVGKYYQEVKKEYRKARDIYQTAYDMYEKNGSIINNESLFLRDFISIHANLQTDIV